MKVTTIGRNKIEEGMIVLIGPDPGARKFYVHESVHNNDDSTTIRGNFSNFWDYPSKSFIYWGYERVKIVLEE